MESMWLGIDVGTGSSRALLVDARGGVRAGYTAAHEEMRMERPLWAEQRPENWWDSVVEAIRGVLAKAGVAGREVKGIGLSGQMHGLVVLDDAGAVIQIGKLVGLGGGGDSRRAGQGRRRGPRSERHRAFRPDARPGGPR